MNRLAIRIQYFKRKANGGQVVRSNKLSAGGILIAAYDKIAVRFQCRPFREGVGQRPVVDVLDLPAGNVDGRFGEIMYFKPIRGSMLIGVRAGIDGDQLGNCDIIFCPFRQIAAGNGTDYKCCHHGNCNNAYRSFVLHSSYLSFFDSVSCRRNIVCGHISTAILYQQRIKNQAEIAFLG